MPLFRTRGRIRREAADWLARLGGGAGAGEHAAFRQWYEADRRNAEAYDRMAAIWSAAGRLPGSASGATEDEPARWSGRSLGYAIAACLVGAVGLALLLLSSKWLPESGGQPESFATAVGEVRELTLPEGSRLVLDSASRIEVRFTSSERLLLLREGRARFIVAHEARPFVVRAASSEVVATGTMFDVSLVQQRMAVLLIEGTVEVRQRGSGGSTVHRLAAGQKLVIAGGSPAVRQPVARGETLWPTRMLEFEDTPLREAVALVNRYSRVQLRLGDERIGDLRISGAFRAGDVAGFARSLAAAFRLRVEARPDGNLLLVDPATAR